MFGIHPLVLEDIVNTEQRPKVENYDGYIYIVIKMLSLEAGKSDIQAEQVSMILGSNYVISFQEWEGDVFSQVRERLRSARGQIRSKKSDYLMYSLIDSVVDRYFSILEALDEKIHTLEEAVVNDPNQENMLMIHHLNRCSSIFSK